MSVRRRPSIWSYFSFGRASRPQHRYSNSVALSGPYHSSDDPFEKLARHSDSPAPQMTSNGRSRFLKAVMLLIVIALLFFFMTPRAGVVDYVEHHTPHVNIPKPNQGSPKPKPKSGGQVATDPTLGTEKCKQSVDSKKPIVQYVVMIDAGSQGSRVHVYRFNNCQDVPDLEDEAFLPIKPGLSSFGEDAAGAAKSLDKLMDKALEIVPKKLWPCTPVAVKATAGLRLLKPETAGENILKAVRTRLETKYPFPVVEGDGVSVMEGKDESVYAWITTNYLLGKIGSMDTTPTAAVFDLGGASTQIGFVPTFPTLPEGGMPQKLAPGDHRYELKFGGREFTLYQHSHLGYGLMEARKAIFGAVVKEKIDSVGKEVAFSDKPITHPCLIPGDKVVIEDLEISGKSHNFTFVGPTDDNSAPQCRQIAEKILEKDHECKLSPCSFKGVYQPPISRTFSSEDIYVFSFFYDRISPLLPSQFTIRELLETTQKVCRGPKGWSSFEGSAEAMKDLKKVKEYCLDLNFMLALLHTGYDMPLDREIKTAKKIKGNELGWCLGASLPLLDHSAGGWKCRVTEVAK